MDKYTQDQLVCFMGAFDNDDLPDGAWWAVLEDGAGAFIKEMGLKGVDANDLVHEYIDALGATK